MRAYILTDVQTGHERDVVQTLKNAPGIIRVDYTFGPYDVVVEAEASSLAALGKLVFETIRCAPGVIETVTCLTVE